MRCGLLNINKPSGCTSRDVVNKITRVLRKDKVGHAGTLDPLASGVLVLCVGPATRLIDSVQRMPKTYRTVIRLNATSDTLDADGAVAEATQREPVTEAAIDAALATQVGEIMQLPPQFSALKVDGKRAYDIARAGETADLAPRLVSITRVERISYQWPRLELEIDCGAGTYIRSIARDVGAALGCGGLVQVLTRTRIGPFLQEDAVAPEDLTRENIDRWILPAELAVPDLPRVNLPHELAVEMMLGRPLKFSRLDFVPPAGEVALLSEETGLFAIGESRPEEGRLWPRKVLGSS